MATLGSPWHRRAVRTFLGLLLLPLSAQAHPLGGRSTSQWLDAHLDRHAITVRYAVDVPEGFLDGRSQSMRSELESGLLVTVDGQTIPWSEVTWQADDAPPSDTASDWDHGGHAHQPVFRGTFVAPFEASGTHVVRITNGNLPGTSAFYARRANVSGDLAVWDSDLLTLEDGQLVDGSSTWGRSERARTLEITVDPRSALEAWHHLVWGPNDPVGLVEATRHGLWTAWSQRLPHGLLALLPLVGAGVGTRLASRGQGARGGTWGVVATLVGTAVWTLRDVLALPAPWAAAAFVGLGAVSAHAAYARVVAALASAVWIGSTQTPLGLTVAVVVAAANTVAGAYLPTRSPDPPTRGVRAFLAVCVLLAAVPWALFA